MATMAQSTGAAVAEQHNTTKSNPENSSTPDGPSGRKPQSEMLSTLIPFYGLISELLGTYLGIDVDALIPYALVIFAGPQLAKFLYRQVREAITDYLSSSVHMESDDDLFDAVLDWMGKQASSRSLRSIQASMNKKLAVSLDDLDYEEIPAWVDTPTEKNEHASIQCEPYIGEHWFTHDRRRYLFERNRQQSQAGELPYDMIQTNRQVLSVSCFGFSTLPIKALLSQIATEYRAKQRSLTIVRRPCGSEWARQNGKWEKISARHNRSFDTVSLDHSEKTKIIADVLEYLRSSQWYNARGIPWRRGYLFHGPPGTGKTSLTFALAGLFNLDIYVIPLSDPNLTESDLMSLFGNLPKRCIVLLEDIDAAGLSRGKDSQGGRSKAKEKTKSGASSKADKGGISLSGLLNVIDGVASPEGRVLVMTTNHPEKLDPALIRPGRIDLQVPFTLATRAQIHDLFVRMYTSNPTSEPYGEKEKLLDNKIESLLAGETLLNEKARSIECDLESTAAEFASKLPEKSLSPAEIQGFLLKRKKDPLLALAEVDDWKTTVLEARQNNVKVATVSSPSVSASSLSGDEGQAEVAPCPWI